MAEIIKSKESLLIDLQISDEQVRCLYLVGSRLHGTSSSDSDWDFIMVVDDETKLPEGKRIERDDIDVTIFTFTEYKETLGIGEEFQLIETVWLPETFKWKEEIDPKNYYFVDHSKLRVAISKIANKGHAYAKILICKENNGTLARKNLAHEFRNLNFGIQIITLGYIADYQATLEIAHELMQETSTDWDYYSTKWGKRAMALQKEFISLTPQKIKLPKEPKHRRGKNKTQIQKQEAPTQSEESKFP